MESRSAEASPQIRQVLDVVERVARVPRPVLILGERGTGKELVARAIHRSSGCSGAFVVVNCAAFSDALLDSELFGHERGAFTGAERRVLGKFELARDGTLFLDEIGNMSLPFQQKILRIVEYGTFLRVGGSTEQQVNTRILAATNADLEPLMDAGRFQRDLYDRLAFEVIKVPALSGRKGDIELLAAHFLQQFMREVPAFQGKRLTSEAVQMLAEYSFPGNVRELKNIIERAVYRDTSDDLTPGDIGILVERGEPGSPEGSFHGQASALERRLIREAYEKADKNKAQAARDLGLPYHQFRDANYVR